MGDFSANEALRDIGPVQVLAIQFGPDARYDGTVLHELEQLEGDGMVRVLDLLFVGLDRLGNDLLALDYQGPDMGGLVGALLGFSVHDAVQAPQFLHVSRDSLATSRASLERLLAQTKPDESIALVLIEHLWARDLQRAISAAGAATIAEGFLSAELLNSVVNELQETLRNLDAVDVTDSEPAGTHYRTSSNIDTRRNFAN